MIAEANKLGHRIRTGGMNQFVQEGSMVKAIAGCPNGSPRADWHHFLRSVTCHAEVRYGERLIPNTVDARSVGTGRNGRLQTVEPGGSHRLPSYIDAHALDLAIANRSFRARELNRTRIVVRHVLFTTPSHLDRNAFHGHREFDG